MRVTTLTITAVAVCALSAWADDNNRGFESGMVGSTPKTTVGGVASGGVPWVATGKAVATGEGRFRVEIRGLLIANGPGVPANLVGTVGPVTMVAASLVCGGSGGTVVGSTDGAPLSAAGDAKMDGTITLPGTCMAPVALIRIFNASSPSGSQLGPFISLSGFNAGANNDNEGHDN